MPNRPNTRITIDIPTVDHKKLKMIAAFHGKSMKEIFVEFIEEGLDRYQQCTKSHEPNDITRQSIENIQKGKGLQKAESVEDLFEKLRS